MRRRLAVVPKSEPIKPIKLDIGCGASKQPGFLGMDIAKVEGVDVVHDWERIPWPFEDEAVEEIYCSQVIEHVRDLIAFMNEAHRILTVGGKMTVIAPYYSSMRAWQDPTHVRAISEASFLYYNKAWRVSQKLDHYPITCDFDFTYGYAFYPDWAARSQEARDFALRQYINVASDVHVVLTKREPS